MKTTRKDLICFVELVAQSLGDWKPDMRVAYGLDFIYNKADKILAQVQEEEL
jgi:hypothetical protein